MVGLFVGLVSWLPDLVFLGLVQCAFLQLLGVGWILDLVVVDRFDWVWWTPGFGVWL